MNACPLFKYSKAQVTMLWLQLFKKVLEKELQVYICLDI